MVVRSKPGAETKSFWSTLPGIVTAIGGLVSAVGGLASSLVPVMQAHLDGADVIPLKEFSKRAVLEGGRYTIRTPYGLVALLVDDVKVGRRTLYLQIGVKGEALTRLELSPAAERVAVIGSHEYLLRVDDFADVVVGADTAQLSVQAR